MVFKVLADGCVGLFIEEPEARHGGVVEGDHSLCSLGVKPEIIEGSHAEE